MTGFISRSRLEALAPIDLPNLRQDRYDGGGESADLSEFAADDAKHLTALYEAVKSLYSRLLPLARNHHASPADIRSIQGCPELDQILTHSRAIGNEGNLAPRLHSIVHDLRGGSLTALLVAIQLLEPDRGSPDEILRPFFYARDHLKMMRNGIPAIDPAQTALDRDERPHAIRLLREKWQDASYATSTAVSRVTLDCEFDGDISNRCMEFSALDRVIYNLMNNAARFAVDHAIGMSIFLPGTPANHDVRFVVQNAITAAQAKSIGALTGGVPSRLLAGGLTTGGNGLGLANCAKFVSHAYGLSSAAAALDGRYLGVQIIDSKFVVWFHWPRA